MAGDALGTALAPSVPVMLDRERRLKLDINALVAFEDQSGKSVMNDGLANLTVRDIRALLWAALQHEDADLTVEQVGAWVHLGNLGVITEKLNMLVSLALPAAQNGTVEAAAGKAVAASTG
jgi:hypothetical protein